MKKGIVILWMLLPLMAAAQENGGNTLLKEGREWVCERHNGYMGTETTCRIVGDTVVGSVSYKKLYTISQREFMVNAENSDLPRTYLGETVAAPVFACALREAEQKVYRLESSLQEQLLYDFSATAENVGEQVAGHVLDGTDYVKANGTVRKRLRLYEPSDNDKQAPTYWIEGIGSCSGLLSTFRAYAPGLIENMLLCRENGETIFSNKDFYADGIETGVQSITAPSPQSSTAFDLQGRPAAKQRRGEIYVTKGRKVIGESSRARAHP